MLRQTIPDDISVIVLYDGGQIKPLRFRWQGKSFKVERIICDWRGMPGDLDARCYSVATADGGRYSLSHNRLTGRWTVSQILTD